MGGVGYVIVGVDPGIHTAICVFDLEGRMKHIESRKNGHKWVYTRILEVGTPIIVASDVADPPAAVRKIAAAFGAKLVCPKEDLPVEYKDEVALKFGVRKDKHVRDALAAAYYALSIYLPRFKKIEKKLQERGLPCTEEIKRDLVFGKSPFVRKSEKTVRKTAKKERDLRYELRVKNEEIRKLKEKIKLLSEGKNGNKNVALELENMKLKAELERVVEALRGLAEGKYVIAKRAENGEKVIYSGEGFAVIEKVEKSIGEIVKEYIEERKKSILKGGSF